MPLRTSALHTSLPLHRYATPNEAQPAPLSSAVASSLLRARRRRGQVSSGTRCSLILWFADSAAACKDKSRPWYERAAANGKRLAAVECPSDADMGRYGEIWGDMVRYGKR